MTDTKCKSFDIVKQRRKNTTYIDYDATQKELFIILIIVMSDFILLRVVLPCSTDVETHMCIIYG